MVPSSYASFFDAASQAAGALIGLLFVVIALRPGQIVGPRADPASRGLAASSFTGLVNAFFVSLLALIPGHNIGIGAATMAVVSLFHTLRRNRGRPSARHILIFVASLLSYGIELGLAIAFVLHPHDADLVTYLTFVLIGCFAVALSRAWQLMQIITLGADQVPTIVKPWDGTEHTEVRGQAVERRQPAENTSENPEPLSAGTVPSTGSVVQSRGSIG